ncbi:MAG: HD domain-containing phosphohydrolase [Spirochaetota bacterium]
MKNRILWQYTVTTAIITIVIAAVMGIIINRLSTDHLYKIHTNIYPYIVRQMIKEHPEIELYFIKSPGDTTAPDAATIFANFLSLGNVFRVKVWGTDGTILWSDNQQIIGENFKDNPFFLKALRGDITYDVAEPEKPENISEPQAGKVLEIYIPLKKDNRTIGIVELYESDRELHIEVHRINNIIWIIVATSGLFLYLSLFFIFYEANQSQKRGLEQLVQTQDVTIFALAYQAEIRDNETGRHLERTALYVQFLAEEIQKNSRYKSYLTNNYIYDLIKSTPLHDIGKVGVPDSILRKPGKLTPEEFDEIKKHCEYGAMILKKAEEKLQFRSFLEIAIQLTSSHHEKWNGAGYPKGLHGEAIPLSGRIMALADVYDALRSERIYKKALPHEECVKIIIQGKDEHFDPYIVKAFLGIEKKFKEISIQLAG